MKTNDGCVTEDSASSSHSTEPHYVRITGHGQMRTWVQFALEFLEKHPTRPLVFHTLPLSAVPGAEKATPDPTKSPAPEAAPKQSTVNIPLLISVVEIVKREYLQACRTSCVGLHQYNEVRCLEELASYSTNREDDPEESESTRGEKAEEARRQELVEVLGGKRYLRVKKTPYMRVTLSRDAQPELVTQGATYQEPVLKQLTKSARARTNKRRRMKEAAKAGAQAESED